MPQQGSVDVELPDPWKYLRNAQAQIATMKAWSIGPSGMNGMHHFKWICFFFRLRMHYFLRSHSSSFLMNICIYISGVSWFHFTTTDFVFFFTASNFCLGYVYLPSLPNYRCCCQAVPFWKPTYKLSDDFSSCLIGFM